MTTALTLFVASLALMMTSCWGDAVDSTRQPETKGPDVVNAVVDLIKASCVFPEDRLFLRRLAFVESQDGYDPDTYTTGYDGGIWKVSQAMLAATTTCPSLIRATCNTIRSQLNVDWTKVTWADLRKPLFSGLAASLFLMVQLGSSSPVIPTSLSGQGQLWSQDYHEGTPARDYATFVANVTDYDCHTPMDIAFIVDGSGSISDGDFKLSRDFVAEVVKNLEEPDVVQAIRAAVVVFATTPNVKFNFNTFPTKAKTVAAIRSLTRNSGGTATDLALDITRRSVFTAGAGARAGAKRVAVLITDGQSNNRAATATEAQRLRKEAGVVVFAIGVGGYDLTELHAIASTPSCSYTYTLGDFSAIQSIIDEIKRSTCKAATYVRPDEPVTVGEGPTTITTPTGEGGVAVTVNCGIANNYLSYTNPNPNPALYDEMATATKDRPVFFNLTSSNGQTLYMTVNGTRLDDCSKEFEANVTRITDLNQFTNPCTQQALAEGQLTFPHPYSPNFLVRCDPEGHPYITPCPQGLTFDPQSVTCGDGSVEGEGGNHLPPSFPNPCTSTGIPAKQFYEYQPDKSWFIRCDEWGNGWLKPCRVFQVWDQNLLTCYPDSPAL